MTKELADIEYDSIIHETRKAWLFHIDGNDVWIPKSVGEIDPNTKTLTVPMRFAVDRELV